MRKLLVILLLLLVYRNGYSANYYIGTSGAQFLKIGVGARPVAMGESFCAVADDINTIHWNPAGLGNLLEPELILSYNKWFADIGEGNIGYIQHIDDIGTFGLSVLYLHMGEEIARDKDTGEQVGTFSAYDASVVLSYGREINTDISLGGNIKVFQEKMEEESAIGICMDLGGLYRLPVNGFTAGISLQNIGPGIRFISQVDSLPLNIKAGLAYCGRNVLISFDFNKPIDNYLRFNLGGEYNIKETFKVRLGYNTSNSLNKGITAGMGIKVADWLIDYAFVPYGNLNNTHRISLSTVFGPIVEKKGTSVNRDKEISRKDRIIEKLKRKLKILEGKDDNSNNKQKKEKQYVEPQLNDKSIDSEVNVLDDYKTLYKAAEIAERVAQKKKESMEEEYVLDRQGKEKAPNPDRQQELITQKKMKVLDRIEDQSSLKVVESMFCKGVENRQPLDDGTEFLSGVNRIYYWTRITGATEPTVINHVWYYNDEEMTSTELTIKYPNHRTWSYKTMMTDWQGAWRVKVIDIEGNVLKESSFEIK